MSGVSAGRPFRRVTGVADPFTGVTFPKIGTWPANVQLFTLDPSPVAITATNAVGDATNTWIALSSGNYSKNLLRVGTYLYLQKLVNKVIGISPDGTTILLEKAYLSAITATNVFVTKNMGAKRIQATSNGSAAAILLGSTMPIGEVAVFDGRQGVEAIDYDASATGAQISFDITE